MRSKGKTVCPVWWDWATFDDDGFVNGIAKDAPDDVRTAYQADLKEKERQEKNGIKM